MTDPRPYHIVSYGTLLGVQVYQSALPVVVALTASKGGKVLGVSGLAAPENRFKTLLPMATAVVTGLANMFVLLPMTKKVMTERKQQETRDGKKSYDAPPHSKKMQALNKKFGRVHGVSSLLNIVSLAATIYYGSVIGKKLQ